MRVLMLTQFYLPFIGGEELLIQNLSLEMVRRGHEVAVVTLRLEGTPAYEVVRGVHVYRVGGLLQRLPWVYGDTTRRFAPPVPDPELALAIARVIRELRPDVVHVHNWIGYSFLPLKAWSGAKLVVSLHDYSLSCATRTFMHHGQQPCSGPGVAKCVSCAVDYYGPKGVATALAHRAMGRAWRHNVDMFLPISRFVAQANGLPGSGLPYRITPEFVADDVGTVVGDGEPWVSQLPAEPYLLFVGAFRRLKGIEVLLKAYAGLQNAPPLVVVGYTTPDAGGPIQFPDNVSVLQNWPNEAVMHAWRRCLFGIVPSLWAEPLGIVALEAMASGKAVVASDIGGLPDMVEHERTGLLVPPGDVAALRSAMQRLVDDAPLRESLGAAGRERVELFKARVVAASIEQTYRDVTSGRAEDAWGASARANVG